MNIYFWFILAGGILAILLLLWDLLEEDSSDHTPEEQALAEYLEKKQTINEIYLKAHAELLKFYKR